MDQGYADAPIKYRYMREYQTVWPHIKRLIQSVLIHC
jgi:hypothetical protein